MQFCFLKQELPFVTLWEIDLYFISNWNEYDRPNKFQAKLIMNQTEFNLFHNQKEIASIYIQSIWQETKNCCYDCTL